MFNKVIPSFEIGKYSEEYYNKEIKCFLKKICLCGLCNNNDKTDKKQIFKCHHYSCGCRDARRWCFICGCDIKR